jgi:hypothetical protein
MTELRIGGEHLAKKLMLRAYDEKPTAYEAIGDKNHIEVLDIDGNLFGIYQCGEGENPGTVVYYFGDDKRTMRDWLVKACLRLTEYVESVHKDYYEECAQKIGRTLDDGMRQYTHNVLSSILRNVMHRMGKRAADRLVDRYNLTDEHDIPKQYKGMLQETPPNDDGTDGGSGNSAG